MSLRETASALNVVATGPRLDAMASLRQSVDSMSDRLSSILSQIETLDRQSGDRLASQVEPLARAMAMLSEEVRETLTKVSEQAEQAKADRLLSELEASKAAEKAAKAMDAATTKMDAAAATLNDAARPWWMAVKAGTVSALVLMALLLASSGWLRGALWEPSQQQRDLMAWGQATWDTWNGLPANVQQSIQGRVRR